MSCAACGLHFCDPQDAKFLQRKNVILLRETFSKAWYTEDTNGDRVAA